jgi:5-methylcytosine-specific restriction endonuclease McrA
VLRLLDVAPYGGNYDVLRKAIKHFGLDTSHFTGQAWNRGRTFRPKQPLGHYLSNTLPIQSFKLRNRLLRDGIFERRCMRCGNTDWLDPPIPLELDHVNGDRHNNRIENLRLLCPNCHALTPTYRNRKRAKA